MSGDNWKWWHFVVAGALIAAYGGYEIYSIKIGKGIGSIILGVLCIVIGFFSRKSEGKSDSKPEGQGPASS